MLAAGAEAEANSATLEQRVAQLERELAALKARMGDPRAAAQQER